MKAQKHTLLIVEDNDDDRFFLERTFNSLGVHYRVHGVRNGNEAIHFLKGEGKFADRDQFEFPSYIITDLKMSPGDGFELLNFLKKNPALSVIPVVMLSASEDKDDIRQAYLLGVSSYFLKPHSQPALRMLINKIHEYWADCEVPEVDAAGYALPTDSRGKLSERFPKPER